jgi:hypothetical protein
VRFQGSWLEKGEGVLLTLLPLSHPRVSRRALIGGSFTRFAGTPRPGIARLNGDAVPTTPRLANTVHSNGALSVSLPTVNGENYFVEFKNSLAADTRTALPAVAGDGTVKTLVDPSATGSPGIYRVRVE